MYPADMVSVQPRLSICYFCEDSQNEMTQHRSGPVVGCPTSVLGAGWSLSRGGGTGQQLCRAASSRSHLLLCPQTQLLQEVGRLHHQVAFII